MKKTILFFMVLAMLLNLAGCVQTVEVIRCGQCDEKNPADAKFCANCGAALSKKPDGGSQTPSHSHPTPNDSLDMENSGKDAIYFGNNVCVDGEVIYLGYYGNLYMFCGNEVAVYSGGGTKTTTVAEMYLYNGYVYYANLDNHCIYRINVADGSREIVLSGVGEIEDTFMHGSMMYVSYARDDELIAIYSLNLDSLESKALSSVSDAVDSIKFGDIYEDFAIIEEIAGDTIRGLVLNTSTGTTEEIISLTSSVEWRGIDSKISGDYLYLNVCTWDDVYRFFRMNMQTHILEESNEEESSAATGITEDDGLEWQYYLAWGSNNLCREHKETGVQEVIVKSGSGNRNEGEMVAKTYSIDGILYADDMRIIFKRARMADGLERSIWMVDSDGNNLTELIRKEYHADAPEPYPTGSPGGSTGSSGISGSDGPTVGTETCALCEGDGRITCYYCKGTGKGTTIYVMGMPTEQGCSYCGSSGWRLCSGCGGHGIK